MDRANALDTPHIVGVDGVDGERHNTRNRDVMPPRTRTRLRLILRRRAPLRVGVTLALVTVLGVAVFSRDARAERTAEWVARMDGLAAALTALLADASEETQPAPQSAAAGGEEARDPALAATRAEERRKRLRDEVTALRSLAHGLASMRATPDTDPTIGYLLRELDVVIGDVGRTHVADGAPANAPAKSAQSAKSARQEESALSSAALAVAWTCMGCHTRSPRGSPRPLADLAPVDERLPADVRGTALAATRRFKEARAVFRKAAFDEELARTEPMRWERSVKGALLLDLRVYDDARGALELADRVVNTPNGERLWRDAADWKRVLVPMVKNPRPAPRTLAELDAEATRLMADANARDLTDSGREILHLRATAVLHELLMRDPPKDMKVQALAWLGESYRALRDLDIWSLHLVYDAACVEAAPHSVLAAECYERWIDGARSSFSGNSGAELPPELATRAEALWLMASPPAKGPSPRNNMR